MLAGQGVFYFSKLDDLRGDNCLVDFNKGRILIYPENQPDKFIAAVSSS